MGMNALQEDIDQFEKSLNSFALAHELPIEDWFNNPDHLAIKCADRKDFDETVRSYKPRAVGRQVSGVDMHGRTLATAQLETPLQVGSLGTVEWLEIMEPRPEKVGKGLVGLEHIEFYFPFFKRVRTVLDNAGITYEEPQDNDHHKCIVVVFNKKGQEFKLNDYPLGKIVAQELDEGMSYLL